MDLTILCEVNADAYKDPEGYFPVFTHASAEVFHMHFGMHLSGKIRANMHAPKQKVLQSGSACSNNQKNGSAKGSPSAIVYKKKPSENGHLYENQPKGEFVRIKPE